MPTVIVTVPKDKGESSVGGIAAGVSISLVFVTVVTVVAAVVVWLLKRYVFLTQRNVDVVVLCICCVGIHCRKQQHKEGQAPPTIPLERIPS